MIPSWTEEQIENLKALLLARDMNGQPSYSEIGAKIGKTKGAIAGYVNRHLQGHRPPARPPKIASRSRPQAAVVQQEVVVAIQSKVVVPEFLPVPLKEPLVPIDGRHECSYVNGDPFDGEWRYCGHQTIAKSSYCAYHHTVTTDVRFRTKRVDKRRWLSDY